MKLGTSCAAAGLGALALLASEPAAAEMLRIDWEAPEVCPDAREVRLDLARLLGRRLEDSAGTVRSVRARVVFEEGAWTVDLRLETEAGTRSRELSDASCRAVTDAAVSVIALAVDPELGSEPSEAADSTGSEGADDETAADNEHREWPDESEAPPAGDTSKDEPASATAASEDQPLGWAVGAVLALDALALPSPAPGLGLRLGLRPGPWRLYAGGLWFPARTESVAGGVGQAEFSLWLGSVSGCYAVLEGSIESSLCLESEVGRLAAKTTGLTAPGQGSSPWWAVGGGVELGWQLSPAWALVGRGSALAPLVRKDFVIGGIGSVHEPPAVTGRAEIGLEMRLP